MNKKGFIWFLWIPIAIIGIIVLYFLLKALIGIVITTIIWLTAIILIAVVGLVIYLIFSSLYAPNKKTRKR